MEWNESHSRLNWKLELVHVISKKIRAGGHRVIRRATCDYHFWYAGRSSSKTLHVNGSSQAVTGNQISLRYIVQQNIPVIPKSNTLEHIKSNLNIFDFNLSNDDMNILKNTTKPAENGDCDVP